MIHNLIFEEPSSQNKTFQPYFKDVRIIFQNIDPEMDF